VRVLVLGPPVVEVGAQLRRPARRMSRVLLGMLALRVNQPVSTEWIVEGLWPGTPPRSAAANVRSHVAGLRGLLGVEVQIHTTDDGYRLSAPVDGVDSTLFLELLTDGRRFRAGGAHHAAADRLGKAVGLWRGRLMEGLTIPSSLAGDAVALEEQQVAAWEELIDLYLDLDRAAESVPLLRNLVVQHAFRERFWAQLMIALHRMSRTSEALDAYRRLRRLLHEELGTLPQNAVTRLYHRLGQGETPTPDTPVPPPSDAPRQLPPDAGHLVGRDTELSLVDDLLGGGAPLGLITGIAGVGKSALAVRWAHTRAAHFPDGQLHCDLRGCEPGSGLPVEVAVAGFLRALGVAAGEVPVAQDEAVRLYRSLLADRKVLVVLDNAASADQVRALRPGSQGCAVLVTSRHRLSGLVARDDAVRVELDPLPAKDSVELLDRIVGDRAWADPAATARIADLCGHLPLALRIAAARVTDSPAAGLAEFAALLDSGTRLSTLTIDDDQSAGLQAMFALSYDALSDAAKAVFRVLGLHPGFDTGNDTGPAALAAMAGTSSAAAGAALTELADAHLVTEVRRGRYGMHDLLRMYAVERAGAELTEAQRTHAVGAGLDWYYRAGHAAATRAQPQMVRLPAPPNGQDGVPSFESAADAEVWLAEESDTMIAAIAAAETAGHDRYTWLLADVLQGQFRSRLTLAQWRDSVRRGLEAARRSGDDLAAAAMLRSTGSLQLKAGDWAESLTTYRQALEHYVELDLPAEVCALHNNIGMALAEDQHLIEAEAELRSALLAAERIGDPTKISTVLANLATLTDPINLGWLPRAEAYASRGIDLSRASDGIGPTALLGRLSTRARIRHALADDAGAAADRAEAIAIAESSPHLLDRPDVLDQVANDYLADGKPGLALDHAARALTAVRRRASPSEETAVHLTLGRTLARLGHHRDSIERFQDALRIARTLSDNLTRVQALLGLAAVMEADGEPDQAIEHYDDALALAAAGHLTVPEVDANLALTRLRTAGGDAARAAVHLEAARAAGRRGGYRRGLAECDRLGR
jgi:DNA-binding SARP family transcriptional activator/tetratricopeptide (TPR) repeat protein